MFSARACRRRGAALVASFAGAALLLLGIGAATASASQVCYFAAAGQSGCNDYGFLGSGAAPMGQWTSNTTGGLMNNQVSGTSKRFRVCENSSGSTCTHRAGWWSSSSKLFSVTWSLRDWRTQQCNNMEAVTVQMVCGYILP